jgi:hypothetical protein
MEIEFSVFDLHVKMDSIYLGMKVETICAKQVEACRQHLEIQYSGQYGGQYSGQYSE